VADLQAAARNPLKALTTWWPPGLGAVSTVRESNVHILNLMLQKRTGGFRKITIFLGFVLSKT